MAKVISTISQQEIDYRIERASAALFDGKRVRLPAGIFRASGIEPQQMIERLLNSLSSLDALIQDEYGVADYKPRQWRVFITRKPDFSFVIQAKVV